MTSNYMTLLVIRYAIKDNLTTIKGWEWIKDYMDLDKVLNNMIHAYKVSKFLKDIKFGVEVPLTEIFNFGKDNSNDNGGLTGLLFLQALRNKIRLKKADTTAPTGNRGISKTQYLSSEVLGSRTTKHCKHNDNCC